MGEQGTGAGALQNDGAARGKVAADTHAGDIDAVGVEAVQHEPAEQVVTDHADERHLQPQTRSGAGGDHARAAEREGGRVNEHLLLPEPDPGDAAHDHIGVALAEDEQVDGHRSTAPCGCLIQRLRRPG